MNQLNQRKNSGFKIPKNYFHNFEDNFLVEIEFKKKIKDSGFEMPPHYLETVEKTILKKTNESPNIEIVEKTILKKTNESPKVVFLKRNYIYVISSIAASVLLLIALNVTNSETPITLNVIENEIIENYVHEEFESLELASLIEDITISESNFINFELSNQTIESLIEIDEELELYIN